MEPIAIQSNLDLKTYYRISMAIYFGTRMVLMTLGSLAVANILIFMNSKFDWMGEIFMIVAVVLLYTVYIPIRSYFTCKKNMRRNPILAEGCTYYITDSAIEGKTTTSNSRIEWSLVKKVVEKDDYFLLFSSANAFRYLPKNGFQSDDDMETLKDIVKQHNIKAYFK